MIRLAPIAAALLLFVSACSGDDAQTNNDLDPDVGVEDSGDNSDSDHTDAEETDGDGADSDAQEGDDCLQVEASAEFTLSYADGASTEYSTETSPAIEGETRLLSLLFERYMDASYEGTFELGTGADANFGTCAHCLFIRGDTAERAFFADRGTLVSNTDPFSRKLDIAVTNLRLVEVQVDGETRSSTPVEDGVCIEVADFTQQGVFPPEAWTCLDENYDDGEYCNCECGAFDPDCSTTADCLPGQPGCEPPEELPVVGCEPEEVCVLNPHDQSTVCTETCDWLARDGCTGGTCVFDFGPSDDDLCINDAMRVVPDIGFGENCPDTGLQLVCNVVDGFATGYCGPNDICRPVCEADSECTTDGETCRKFEAEDGLGYCGPQPQDG